MEEEKKEEKIEETKDTKTDGKNVLKNMIFVVSLLVCFSLGYLFAINFGGSDNKTNSNTNTNANVNENTNTDKPETPKELSEAELNELYNIAELNSTEPVSMLLSVDGKLSDLDMETKSEIAFKYAQRNQLTTGVTSTQTDKCDGGSGLCSGVKITDFNKIIKKYGFAEFVPQIYGRDCYIYNEMYLFNYGGNVTASISHNYSHKMVDNDVVITDVATFNGANTKTETREYTFKLVDGSYYLYSIYKK